MNVNDFYTFVLFLLRKSQAGGNPSPDQFNLAMVRGFAATIMGEYGNTAEYQPGMPIPRVAWQATQKITDDLNFLIVDRKFRVVDGSVNIPNGTTVLDYSNAVAEEYMHLSSITSDFAYKDRDGVLQTQRVPVDVIRHDQKGAVLSSSIVKPKVRYPACSFYKGYLDICPKSLDSVWLTYLRQPAEPKWGSTLVNSRPVYDEATSVDIDAPKQLINNIVLKTLSFLGMSAREIGILNVSEQMQQKGL